MLDQKYLQYGLDALSRAHQTNYFTDGHRGAAILSAYFFCQEVEVEQGVADLLSILIDTQWVNTPLCAPMSDEAYEATGIEQIIGALEKNIGHLRQVGHNVIFPSLALKAFQHYPGLLTHSRVEGICKLIEAFTISEPLTLDSDDTAVDFRCEMETVEFILVELLKTIDTFDGRGQGWSGHLLTYGRALLDLRKLGYIRTAEMGYDAFSLYIKRIRMGPLDTDKLRPEHRLSDVYPHQVEYWKQRNNRPLNLGHSIKYPYGFYGMLDLVENDALISECFAKVYHIF